MNLSVFVWTLGDAIAAFAVGLFALLLLVLGLVIAWERFVHWIRNKFKQ